VIKYYSILTLYCILWALKDVVTRLLLDVTNPVQLTFLLSLFSTVYALIFILARTRAKKEENPYSPKRFSREITSELFLLSSFSAIAFLCVVYSIADAGPVLYTLVDNSFYPVFVSILAHVVLREKFPIGMIAGLLVAMVGILVFQLQALEGIQVRLSAGIILAISSSLFYALSITLIKRVLSKGISPEEVMFYRFLVIDILLFLYLLVRAELSSTSNFWQIAILAMVGYALPFYMSFYSLRKVPANIFGMFFLSVPIFSFIFSALLLPGLTFKTTELLGGGLVFVGLLIGLKASFQVERQT